MILESVLQNVLANTIDDEINTGAGTAELKFETSADVEVATISLQNPAFGAASGGSITLQGVPLNDPSATGGEIAQASVYDRDATKQFELTVATAAAEIIITSTTVAATEQVDLTGLVINVPAS
jgi:hypothetical protein